MRSLAPSCRADLDACRVVVAIEEIILAGERTSPKAASHYARQIVGCFRAKDFLDADTFVVALVAHLVLHPEVVVKMLACPINGIARSHQFCPSIAEIADALERMSERVKLVAGPARRALQSSS